MLQRLKFNQNYKLFVRFSSKIPSENEGKRPEVKSNEPEVEKENSESPTEKIQALLKSMMAEPKISENEYRDRFTTANDIHRRRKQKDDKIEVKTQEIEKHLTNAATEVAQAIGGDVKQTESELLSKVLGKINQTSTSLSDLLIGMKIDRSKESEDLMKRETRGQQVKRIVNQSQLEVPKTRYSQRKEKHEIKQQNYKKNSSPQATVVNIFSGEPLGIFNSKDINFGTTLNLWERLNQRELALATSQPPANYFQKMIQWTEQGKIWKFPINNEQGLEEESNVHFSEHIFIDSHLEGWCPTRGPIRHFMELVCVGLSKNAFYTVQEKKGHIMWYKEYFESKKDLLTEVGVWDAQPTEKDVSM